MSMWLAGLVVLCTSAAVLVLEILAGRLLAPYLGVTLETWTRHHRHHPRRHRPRYLAGWSPRRPHGPASARGAAAHRRWRADPRGGADGGHRGRHPPALRPGGHRGVHGPVRLRPRGRPLRGQPHRGQDPAARPRPDRHGGRPAVRDRDGGRHRGHVPDGVRAGRRGAHPSHDHRPGHRARRRGRHPGHVAGTIAAGPPGGARPRDAGRWCRVDHRRAPAVRA